MARLYFDAQMPSPTRAIAQLQQSPPAYRLAPGSQPLSPPHPFSLQGHLPGNHLTTLWWRGSCLKGGCRGVVYTCIPDPCAHVPADELVTLLKGQYYNGFKQDHHQDVA